MSNFEKGRITRLCDCGCNSFDIEVDEHSGALPLAQPSERGGMVVQLEFYTAEEGRTVGVSVFADKRGHLSGMDVDCSGNAYPMPDAPKLKEPPFDVRGELRA